MDVERFAKFDALIFDMDGTLIDSGQLHEAAWTEALQHFGLPVDRPYMRSLCGVPTLDTVEKIVDKFSISLKVAAVDVHRYKEDFVSRHLADYLKPTALEKMATHYFGHKPMAVGTGAHTEEAHQILASCGLLDKFDSVIGADQVKKPKPAPDTFLLCAKQLGVEANRCVVFEDSPLGLQAASDAGMTAIDVASELDIHNDYFL